MTRYWWLYPLIGVVVAQCWRLRYGRRVRRGEWIVTTLFWPVTLISLLFHPARRNEDAPPRNDRDLTP